MAAPGQAAPREVVVVADEREPMAVFGAFLEKNGISTRILDQPAFRSYKARRQPDAMMMYVHGKLDDDTEAALVSYARQGGRLILLHHGIASARMRNKLLLPFAGIVLMPRDSPAYPWKVIRGDVQVVNLRPGHYITSHKVQYDRTVAYTPSDTPSAEQQLPAIELPDTEAFLNQLFSDGRNKTVLLGFKCRFQDVTCMQDRAGWYMPVDKGRLFYFQQGHNGRDFENVNFSQMILNSLDWQPGPE